MSEIEFSTLGDFCFHIYFHKMLIISIVSFFFKVVSVIKDAYYRVEIIITIYVENCTNIRAKFSFILYENCSTNCYCNFNPCGIFESMTSFTPILNQDLEQGKLMAAVNSRK